MGMWVGVPEHRPLSELGGVTGLPGTEGWGPTQESSRLVSPAGRGHSWGPSARQSPGKVPPHPDTTTVGGLQGAQPEWNRPGFGSQARSVKAPAQSCWSALSSCPFC